MNLWIDVFRSAHVVSIGAPGTRVKRPQRHEGLRVLDLAGGDRLKFSDQLRDACAQGGVIDLVELGREAFRKRCRAAAGRIEFADLRKE